MVYTGSFHSYCISLSSSLLLSLSLASPSLLLLFTMRLRLLLPFLTLLSTQELIHAARRLTPNYPGDDGHRREVAVPLPTDPEDHRVKGDELPLFDGSLKTNQYAGLLPASSGSDKYFFYWLFYPDIPKDFAGKEEDIPLLIWLNGGPGCTSMDGLFLENGPLMLVQEGNQWKLTSRPTSWHTSPAYVVYVDQPVGTGLSFTTSNKYPGNDDAVNVDFYFWLTEFLQLHSNVLLNDDKKSMKRPFFFSGESHAGHYIPSMMAHIQAQNSKNPPIQMKLSGSAIGNGWVDPYHQYAAAAASYGHGIIGMAQLTALNNKEKECQANLAEGKYVTNVCFNLLDDIVSQSYGKSSGYKVSQYDIRTQEPRHGSRTFPPGHKNMEQYLGGKGGSNLGSKLDDVLFALHASPSLAAGQHFQECTDPPYTALAHQDGLGVTSDVQALLKDSSIHLLFFNGIMDLICNHVGNEIMLEKLEWQHQDDWITAPRYAWKSSGEEVAGYAKEYKNLSFLKLMNSGHMAPLDQPDICLDMMRTFMYGKSFGSSEQTLDRAVETDDSDSGKASCPTCPTCPVAPSKLDANDDDATPPGTPTDDTPLLNFVIAHSWIGAGLAFFFFLGVCISCRGRRGPPPLRRAAYNNVGVELEMNESYRDEPEP
jgi:carboxypeptidase D